MLQAHYPSSYSNRAWLTSFLGFYSYLPLVKPTNQVRAAVKISAGGVGSPFTANFTPRITNPVSMKISSME